MTLRTDQTDGLATSGNHAADHVATNTQVNTNTSTIASNTAAIAAKVPTSRLISTTAPLTGGGDLSADRTLAVSDATPSSKGVIELAGDLGGTAASPLVKSTVTKIVAPQGSGFVADYYTDGTADEVQIQAAANDISGTGGEIVLRAGTYVLSATVILYSGITLSGEGRGNTILTLSTNANCDFFNNSDQVTSTNTDIYFRDFTIDGNKANQSNGNPSGGLTGVKGRGIFLKNVTRCSIERVDAHDTYNRAIYFYNCFRGIISRCEGRDCGSFQEQVFTLESCNQCIYSDCYASGGKDRNFEIAFCTNCELHNCISENAVGAALAIYATGAPLNSGIIVDGFIAITPSFEGIYLEGVQKSSFSNIYVYTPGTYGIKNWGSGANMQDNRFENIYIFDAVSGGISTDSTRDQFSNIHVYNSGGTGIRLTTAFNTLVNCYVDTNGNDGLWLGPNAHNTVVTGSTFKNSGQLAASGHTYGIRVDSDYNTITGNRCYDDRGTPTQTDGIHEISGADYNNIHSNNLNGAGGGLTVVGVHTAQSGNGAGITMPGTIAKTILLGRSDSGGGNGLTLQSGGAASSSTDQNGATLTLSSGIPTGNGSSTIDFWTAAPNLGTGQTDRSPTFRYRLTGDSAGRFIIGTNTPTGLVLDGISMEGNHSHGIGNNRQPTSNTIGNNFTVFSGGATIQATNKAAGNLVLTTGLSTGSGGGSVLIQTAAPTGSTLTALASVAVSAEGSGYTAADVLTITGGGGSSGTATVGTVAVAGQLATAIINAAGTGYTIGNVLTIAGGTGGTVTVSTIDVNGGVIKTTLSAGGSGYSAVGAAAVTGGTGTGATFTTTIHNTGGVLTIALTTPGTGYALTTGAATSGGTGTGATLNLVPNANTDNTPATRMAISSAAIDVSSLKITSLANGVSSTDAAAFGQIPTSAATIAGLLAANNLSDVANATTSRGNLTAAKSGANSDITSLSSLSTPLSVAQGGTGVATLTGLVLGNGASAMTTVTAPAGTVLGTTDTQTLTNKRITQRVVSMTDATSFTPTGDTADINTQVNTQAAGTLTANSPSGTPTDGQRLTLRIKSTNVQTYSWDTIYRGSTAVALPATSSGGGLTDYLGFIYNNADTKWDCVAVTTGF